MTWYMVEHNDILLLHQKWIEVHCERDCLRVTIIDLDMRSSFQTLAESKLPEDGVAVVYFHTSTTSVL